MMSQISVGDTVMIGKPMACGCTHSLGHVFIVAYIGPNTFPGLHPACGLATYRAGSVLATDENDYFRVELYRLKKLEPPSILQSTLGNNLRVLRESFPVAGNSAPELRAPEARKGSFPVPVYPGEAL